MADASIPSSGISAPAAAPSNVTPPTTNNATQVSDAANQVAEQASPTAENKAPTQQELKEAVKKWKLKSKGQTREVTDEAELVRLAQLGLGANEKFEQAAQSRKKAEAIIDLFQKDPAKALKALGHDVRKLAEEYLYTEAQKQMMTPEQREKMEITQEIERLKADKEQMLKDQQETRISQLQAKYEHDIQNDIIKAIDKYKLPSNPKTVARIAEYMANALENGYELTPQDVAPRVRQDLEEEHRALYNDLSVEDLLKIIGDGQLKKIREYEINKVKSKAPASPTQVTSTPTAQAKEDYLSDKPKKGITWEEFEAQELSKYRGK